MELPFCVFENSRNKAILKVSQTSAWGKYPTVIPTVPPLPFSGMFLGMKIKQRKKALTFDELVANFCNAANAEPREFATRCESAPRRVSRTPLLRLKKGNRKA
jgi:hypothetical protein